MRSDDRRKIPWFRVYPADFLEDVNGLSLEDIGAFMNEVALRQIGAVMAAEPTVPRYAVSVPEFATSVGVGVSLAKELVASGRVRSKKIGRRRVILVSEFERFLSEDNGHELC